MIALTCEQQWQLFRSCSPPLQLATSCACFTSACGKGSAGGCGQGGSSLEAVVVLAWACLCADGVDRRWFASCSPAMRWRCWKSVSLLLSLPPYSGAQ